jgi:hypothetical protein
LMLKWVDTIFFKNHPDDNKKYYICCCAGFWFSRLAHGKNNYNDY